MQERTPPHGSWHIAEINIARLRLPLTHPEMASFVAQLDRINRLAEESPGFVWRLKPDVENAYVAFDQDDRVIANMSVWTSIEALHSFTYRAAHGAVFRQRKEWFEPHGAPYLVLWWIPAGELPTLDEGRRRLTLLTTFGPTPQAFTFNQRFAPDHC